MSADQAKAGPILDVVVLSIWANNTESKVFLLCIHSRAIHHKEVEDIWSSKVSKFPKAIALPVQGNQSEYTGLYWIPLLHNVPLAFSNQLVQLRQGN